MIRLDRNNLFDLVRLYAALQVLLHHGASHLDYPLPDLVGALFSFPGVPIFFALSGFLVSISWINNSTSHEGWKSYAVSRSLRIFPALWCAAIFGWLICLLFGKASFALSPLGFAWLLGQGSFVTFFNPDQLRDFGVGVMNGSLWTIPVEIEFYILVPLFTSSLAWIFRRNRLTAITIAVGVVWASFSLQHYLTGSILAGDGTSPRNASLYLKLMSVSVLPYIGQFLLGASFVRLLTRLGQAKCSRLLIFSGLFLGILVRLVGLGGIPSVLMSNLSLGAFFVGLGLVSSRFQLPGDISYGLYLYHMPVINLSLVAFAGVGKNYLFFLFLLFTTLISICSWIFLEKPCLELRKTLVPKLAS
ncbi:acyltransferase family protein [Synechococcus sp. MVIR-18-1]|nr:acyltransferase family protein [Synechococcus sp. MVIR-18-1]